MTSSESATVQTLTAEVRTLVVGSRQVTMSVYGQLDSVPADRIIPFGRVRSRGDDGWVSVVGRCIDTGALVRASARASRPNDDGWSDVAPDVARFHRELATAREWSALPLIVLAGLR